MTNRSLKRLQGTGPIALLAGPVLALTACGGEGDAAGPGDCGQVTARASHHNTAQSAGHRGLETLADELAERTDGRVTIDVFSDAQLGSLAEMPENLRSGVVDIAVTDSSSLSSIVGEVGVFDLPFMFEDMSEFNDLMDSSVGDAVNDLVTADAGIVPLYWSAAGLRDMFFVSHEVRTPADMAGLIMRVPEAPVWVDTFRALGTSPTAIASGELYTSLQTGVVDGFEAPLGAAVDLKVHEPVSTVSDTNHILTNILIAAAPQFVESLCEADAEALTAAAELAEEETRRLWTEDNDAAEAVLTEELTVVGDTDVEAFREATAGVHEDFIAQHGSDLYDQIQQQLGR